MIGIHAWSTAQPNRCTSCGWATREQGHSPRCNRALKVAPDSEFAVFVAALKAAARPDGLIHQTDVRPLIQRIPHKHRGTLYRKARTAGLIELVGKEPSTDVAGRNSDKDQRVYRLRAA